MHTSRHPSRRPGLPPRPFLTQPLRGWCGRSPCRARVLSPRRRPRRRSSRSSLSWMVGWADGPSRCGSTPKLQLQSEFDIETARTQRALGRHTQPACSTAATLLRRVTRQAAAGPSLQECVHEQLLSLLARQRGRAVSPTGGATIPAVCLCFRRGRCLHPHVLCLSL